VKQSRSSIALCVVLLVSNFMLTIGGGDVIEKKELKASNLS
jgi:hypothetical protein